MNILISHIEYLLTENDCVIVPGWGGFVVQHHPAIYDTSAILPPSREICFNQSLIHDDGTLLSSVSLTQGIPYSEARSLIKNDLEILKARLLVENKINFGKIGSFSVDQDNTLLFESIDNQSLHTQTFGFAPLTLRSLDEFKDIHEPKEHKSFAEQDGDIIHIRFSKRKLLRAVTSAAIIVFLWMFSASVEDQHSNTNYAGLISQMDFSNINSKIVTQSSVDSLSKPGTLASPEVANVSQKDAAKVDNDRFFIILGCFHSSKSAEKFCSQLEKNGLTDIKMKKIGSLIYTYQKSFSDKEIATKYMNDVRYDRDEFVESWLYCMK